ncbi:MAG: hypothetical protein ACJAT3_001282 [Akkermansiaceae bacterium]|jgi:hypothetical protein|tara:strand:- start:244 stop:462 length:219 start_codon:yes stop_codon:yes gene_type:complete
MRGTSRPSKLTVECEFYASSQVTPLIPVRRSISSVKRGSVESKSIASCRNLELCTVVTTQNELMDLEFLDWV